LPRRIYSPIVVRLLLSILYAVNLTTSYLLMLAVMTFNVGYVFAVIAGLALGHFIFFPPASGKNPPSMLSEACCPQS
jgi:copper transporter 1